MEDHKAGASCGTIETRKKGFGNPGKGNGKWTFLREALGGEKDSETGKR